MALGKKVSPAKFIGMVAAGLGVVQGATQIVGGIAERRRLKREMGKTKKQFRANRRQLQSLQFEILMLTCKLTLKILTKT